MNKIKKIFRKVSTEERELRANIHRLQREITEMYKALKLDQKRWNQARRRQIESGLRSGESRINQEWINAKVSDRIKAIRLQETKLVYYQNQTHQAAAAHNRQDNLFALDI